MKRKIVVLCGSTCFYQAFQEANYRETLAGHIVLTVSFDPHVAATAHGETIGITPEQKAAMDALHFDKIAIADEVLVLNVGGYIGDSTQREIAHAKRLGKPIRYLEPHKAEPRTWEVAWYQQLVLLAGGTIEPETLEGGLTQTEAEVRRLVWQADLADAVGVVVIARLSPPASESAVAP